MDCAASADTRGGTWSSSRSCTLPVRVIARRFELSQGQRFRHRRLHMPPQLVAAIAAAAHPSEIDLEQLQRSRAKDCSAPSSGSERGSPCSASWPSRPASSAPRPRSSGRSPKPRAHQQALGHDRRPHLDHEHPDQPRLPQARGAIVAALKPFPEAAQAVGAALAELELEAAEDIAESEKPLLLEAIPC